MPAWEGLRLLLLLWTSWLVMDWVLIVEGGRETLATLADERVMLAESHRIEGRAYRRLPC